jgi:methyl-accepting chemotaxis protein
MSIKLNLSKKIFLQGIAIIVCFALVLTWVVLESKNKLRHEILKTITGPVELAYTLMTEYDERVKKGEFKLEEGQKRASLRIQSLRYFEKEYFWINDLGPRMIMHPYKPEMNGKDLTDYKDPNGKLLFVEMVNVCKEKGEGMVEYMWPKHEGNQPVGKLSYVKLYKPWGWIVGTGVYIDDMNKEMAKLSYMIVVLTILVGLGGLLFSFFMSRSITKPIVKGVDFARKMSEGDFTQTLQIDQKDEIGVLAGALNQMGSNLKQMFQNIARGVQTLASSATALSAISGQTASGVKSMSEKTSTVAAAAEEASANTNSVVASMEQASTNLGSVASATEEMSATVGEIASNSEKARAISEQATAKAQAISKMMQQLGEAAKEIGKVTETITDISSQTNLLALNATIEAARAGAAGKGFAVVANEIKELARQTAAATEDIKAKIAGVQTSTGAAIADIEKITGVIKEVGSIVSTIAAAIEEQATVTKDVAGNIAQASTGVKEANERVAQTAAVSKSIAQDIAGVNAAVGEIRHGGEQVQASAGELSKLAEQLKGMVGQFKV